MGQFVRILLIAIVVWLVVRLVRRWLAGPGRSRPPQVDEVVPCAYCGTYVPKTLAFRADDRTYCSPQHATIKK